MDSETEQGKMKERRGKSQTLEELIKKGAAVLGGGLAIFVAYKLGIADMAIDLFETKWIVKDGYKIPVRPDFATVFGYHVGTYISSWLGGGLFGYFLADGIYKFLELRKVNKEL
ncbi:MAG: hypothetical protein QW559_01235 [Candidatus Woesearchaeota archaeon]